MGEVFDVLCFSWTLFNSKYLSVLGAQNAYELQKAWCKNFHRCPWKCDPNASANYFVFQNIVALAEAGCLDFRTFCTSCLVSEALVFLFFLNLLLLNTAIKKFFLIACHASVTCTVCSMLLRFLFFFYSDKRGALRSLDSNLNNYFHFFWLS